ncbi:MAG: L-threonylcarbamoyladenylate synthase [Blastocatellia bacterium]|nr:L-threonylcarbamoyladenylate synthase [Blastocatellia bacterium]
MSILQTTNSQISDVIARGGVIAYRTDTFYGLGADPFNRDAVQKIKQLKGRDDHKAILIIISDRQDLSRFIAEPTPQFNLLAEAFWPGPLTLIGPAAADVPDEITAGTKSIGVRLPNDENLRGLVRACGGALTATSANPSNQPPATSAQEVFRYLGEAIDLIVDGGEVTTDQPSTVVDVSDVGPKLIREGAIAWLDIQAALASS